MNCRKVSSSLSAYIDGELSGGDHRMIFGHLKDCTVCSEEYEGLLQMKRMVSMLKVREPLSSLPSSIISQVDAERIRPSFWMISKWSAFFETFTRPISHSQLAAGASFAVVCVLILGRANRHQEKIEWTPPHTGGIASLDTSPRLTSQLQPFISTPLQFTDSSAMSNISWGETNAGFQPSQSPTRDTFMQLNPQNRYPSNRSLMRQR